MIENLHAYPAPVWTRFVAAPHAGRLEGATREAQVESRAERLRLRLQWDGRRARFTVFGCPVTFAVGEWLCERLEAGTAARGITAAEIRAALEIPEDKTHCALMGEDALKELLK